MTTAVFIDGCAWNHFFDSGTDLGKVLPAVLYRLFITSEVGIELQEIPEREDKQALKAFIQNAIVSHKVLTTRIFGFASNNADGTPTKYQRFGNFNNAGFQPAADRDWYGMPAVIEMLSKTSTRDTFLGKNEGDASLAVRSFRAVVLTAEKRTKKGPLQLAAQQGGLVVFLGEVEKSGKTLHEFICALQNGQSES
jgi:hypothetical protein